MDDSHQDFAFVDGGRTFTCQVDVLRQAPADAWWWFRVSTEEHQRYAPFRAAADDTPDDVRGRVVAYYDNLLARRAEPAQRRWRRRAPADAPAAADAADSADAATATAVIADATPPG